MDCGASIQCTWADGMNSQVGDQEDVWLPQGIKSTVLY